MTQEFAVTHRVAAFQKEDSISPLSNLHDFILLTTSAGKI
jgi:hypothetical protein